MRCPGGGKWIFANKALCKNYAWRHTGWSWRSWKSVIDLDPLYCRCSTFTFYDGIARVGVWFSIYLDIDKHPFEPQICLQTLESARKKCHTFFKRPCCKNGEFCVQAYWNGVGLVDKWQWLADFILIKWQISLRQGRKWAFAPSAHEHWADKHLSPGLSASQL